MRKIITALAVLAALALTGCDDKNNDGNIWNDDYGGADYGTEKWLNEDD